MTSNNFSFSGQSFKYWEIFLSWLFKYQTRCYEIQGDAIAYENPSESLNDFGMSYRDKMGSKGIICRVTSHFEAIEKTSEILKNLFETVDNPKLCEWAACEILAKVMAYRNLKVGHTFSFPVMRKEGEMELTTYVVDRVFNLWNEICAFGLLPSEGFEGAPILLFRGTDFSIIREGGRASIISDLDPKGPGYSLFEKGKKSIHKWLQKRSGPGRVIGHSLGGAIACYTLIHESEFMSQKLHESSYAFNFPGVTQELAEKWEILKEKPQFQGFVCRGDLISKLGTLFGNIYEVAFDTPLSPIRAHEMLVFASPRGLLHEVDLPRENASSSRSFYSNLRKQTSSIIYEFGLKFFFPG